MSINPTLLIAFLGGWTAAVISATVLSETAAIAVGGVVSIIVFLGLLFSPYFEEELETPHM